MGTISYLNHFYRWTMGDGLLLDRFPEHVYFNLPTVIEASPLVLVLLGLKAFVLLWTIELLCEAHASIQSENSKHLTTQCRIKAALTSGIVKNIVDFGHTWYFIKRGRVGMLFRRFDWFCNLSTDVVVGETSKFRVRWVLWMCFMGVAWFYP